MSRKITFQHSIPTPHLSPISQPLLRLAHSFEKHSSLLFMSSMNTALSRWPSWRSPWATFSKLRPCPVNTVQVALSFDIYLLFACVSGGPLAWILWKKTGDIFQINSYSIRLLYDTWYVRAKVLQSGPTPCSPMDHSLPGFSVHQILRERILEWVAMPKTQGIFPTQGSNLHLLCLH